MIRHLLVALMVLSAFSPALAVGVPDVRLTVTDATVSPATPLVGETVTVTATVQNSVGSQSPVEITSVSLRSGGERLAQASDLGSLSSGDSLTVPLTTTFEEPGTETLKLVVVGRDANGEGVRIVRPVPVAVERAVPQLELDVVDPAVDAETRVQVTVSNPAESPVRNLVVSFATPLGDPVVERRTLPLLDAGETAVVNLTTVPDASGEQDLRVALAYTSDSGAETETTFEQTVDVDPYVDDVGLLVRPAVEAEDDSGTATTGDIQGILSGGGSVTDAGQAAEDEDPVTATTVEVVVTNFGTVPLDDVVVTPKTGDRTFPRQRVDGPLAPGERGVVRVDLADVRNATDVTFDVSYEAGVRESETSFVYRYRPAVGDVVVTDANVERADDGALTISGNVANTGRAEVTGLVVSVVAADGVRPAYPQRDYFVGTVGGSDFAPFDLRATADDSVDAVPVRVSYQVDGVHYEDVTELAVAAESTGNRRNGIRVPTGGLLGAILLVGVPLAALTVAFGVRRWR